MGHGTRVPQLGPLDESSALRDRASAGEDHERWGTGAASWVSASRVSLPMPQAAASFGGARDASDACTEHDASKLFYPMRASSGSEDETLDAEIVEARAVAAYLTAHYVRHARHRLCCVGRVPSHPNQFFLREQNLGGCAALVAQRAASHPRESRSTQAGEA